MEYFTTTSKASKRAADCVIVGVYERGKLGAAAADIDAASKGQIARLTKSGDVSGSLGRSVVLRDISGVRAARVVVVGLGKVSEFGHKQFRKAMAAAIGSVTSTKSKQVINGLTLEEGCDTYYQGRATAEVIGAALYRFTEMKSGRKPAAMPLRKVGMLVASRGDANRAIRGAEHGEAIDIGASLAKDLGNLPPNVCTPIYLARTAQKLAKNNSRLTTRIINEADMKRLGMHSLLSVTAGTDRPAKLIVMQYKGAGRDAPVVLVGKGVTFDTGGIS